MIRSSCRRSAMLEALGRWLGVPVLHSTGLDTTARLNPWYEQIGHGLFTLLAAVLGGVLARLFFAAPADRPESDETRPAPDRPAAPDVVPEADDRRPGGPGAGRLVRHDRGRGRPRVSGPARRSSSPADCSG